MRNPYFRLLFITANVVLWSALVIFFIRFVGNQQTYTQYKHKILNENYLYIYNSSDAGEPTKSINIINKNKNWIPAIDIEFRGDYWHVIQVLSKKPYNSASFGSLETYLKNNKSDTLLINIKNKQLFKFAELESLFQKYPDLSIIMTSETNAILREVRNKKPKWVFMSSHSLISRLQLMGAIFLETATQIDSDIILVNSENEFSDRIISEIKKRKKHFGISLKPNSGSIKYNQFNVFISSDLNQLLSVAKVLDQSPTQ